MHYKEHGGPVRMGEENKGQTARYTGSLLAQTLAITVTLAETRQTLGTFRLKHNQEPHIVEMNRMEIVRAIVRGILDSSSSRLKWS